MANIKVTTLGGVSKIKDSYIYSDLKLDLSFDYSQQSQFLKTKEIKDIVVSYDVQAIKNSLTNIFNTNKGELILSQDFGLNLRQYLFSPISDINGRLIGDAILQGITRYEPRVAVDNVTVATDYDNQQYIVQISVTIPSLRNSAITFTGILSNVGFAFVN